MCIMKNIREDNERLMYTPEYKVMQSYELEGRKYVISFLGKPIDLRILYSLRSSDHLIPFSLDYRCDVPTGGHISYSVDRANTNRLRV